jgi:hypothetical protein
MVAAGANSSHPVLILYSREKPIASPFKRLRNVLFTVIHFRERERLEKL